MKLIGLIVLFFQFSISVKAFPIAPFEANLQDSMQLQNDISKIPRQFFQYNFAGIIKLNNCSGSLVAFQGMSKNKNALMLTNGHCVPGFIDPGKSIKNRISKRDMVVFDSLGNRHRLKARRIMYATMTGTDAAIYELEQTYQQILDEAGILPLVIYHKPPKNKVRIEIISGYWERGYTCQVDKTVPKLYEDDWEFTNSIRYSEPGCDTIGGTSGSPILAFGSRVVIGVNNTSNKDGQRCTMNNPCEVDKSGNISVIQGASYGQQTYQFYACLTQNYEIDPALPGCTLTK